MPGLHALSQRAIKLEAVREQIIAANKEDWDIVAPALIEWVSSFATACGAQVATDKLSVYMRALRLMAEIIYVMGYRAGQ